MTDLALTSETLSSVHHENGETTVLLKFKTDENPRALNEIIRIGNINGVVPMNYHPALYGEQAKKLRLSSFFRTPAVWDYIGKDEDYQHWCRALNKCARTGKPSQPCDPIVFAHCRRVKFGAGTGTKPAYRGIPLLNTVHMRQHQHGESSVGGKEWFEKKSIDYVHSWGWETLKNTLRYESWNQVPPEVLFNWAQERGIEKYLPKEYKPAKLVDLEYRG